MRPLPPEHQPWGQPAEAGLLYWLAVTVVGLGLLAFVLWALYGRLRPGRMTTPGYHALGALVLVLTLFTLVLYLIPAAQTQNIPASDRAWDWKRGEVLKDPGGSELSGEPYRGYLVYLANGCTYCHTLYLRPQDVLTGWGEGAKGDEVSQAGDYVNYPFTLLGTQRDGPDLSVVGRRIPDMRYQIDHLIEPRRFKPRSVMPTYRYLSERDLQDLAAYLISLGNDPQRLRAGELIKRPEALSEAAQKGQQLYRSLGCVACHSVDGSPNVGPTWLGLWAKQETLQDGTVIPVNEEYLAESMRDPGSTLVKGFSNVMPAYTELTEEDVHAIIEYIKSLGAK